MDILATIQYQPLLNAELHFIKNNYKNSFIIMSVSSKKKMTEVNEECACQESCCPSSPKDEIKYLLRICYTEWVIMAILATMLDIRMTTYLDDDDWMWYVIYSGIIFIFGIPFVVGIHDHTDPTCNCFGDKEHEVIKRTTKEVSEAITPRTTKKQPEFGLLKKVKQSLGFGMDKLTDDSSSGESSSSSIAKKKRKSKSRRNLKRSTKMKRPVSGLIKSSTESVSSSSSSKVARQKKSKTVKKFKEKKPVSVVIKSEDEEPKETTIVVKEEIFKGSDVEEEERTVSAKLVIQKEADEEDKFNYDLVLDIDPDEDDHMSVDVHGQVEGGEMTVATHAATDGEGKADVVAKIQYGDEKDKDEVVMIVSSESSR